MFDQIFTTLAPIITIILIGYIFGRTISIDVRQLTDVSLYIFTSALVFHILIHTQISTADILLMGIAITILYTVLAITGILTGVIKGYSANFISASLLCILFVNSGNMGLPFNLFAYGQRGLEVASLYLVFNAIFTQSFGIFIAARGQKSTLQSLSTVFRLPLIYTILIALLVRIFHITEPQFIFISIDLLQQAAVPLLLTILGIQIAKTEMTQNWGKLNYIIFVRLFLSPVLAYLIALLLDLEGLLKKVFIIQSAMPVAVNSVIIALKFNTRPNMVANAVVISTIISIISLAVVFIFVETF